MKKLSKKSAKRMSDALSCALNLVKQGEFFGICAGIEIAADRDICTSSEADYLKEWIVKMLGSSYVFLESYPGAPWSGSRSELRYQLRQPWVNWMIQHLRETT